MPTRAYETMLLLDGKLSDSAVEEAIKKFTDLVVNSGGTAPVADLWGRRRLAYEIDHQWDGYYAVFTYELDAEQRTAVEEALPFIEGVIRSKTVRPEIKARSEAQEATPA